jgi:hypothetical protein
MRQQPVRTGSTSLTDDQLFICDVLVTSNQPINALGREAYIGVHNLPYSHSLDTVELERMIDVLLGLGLLYAQTEPFSLDPSIEYGLTEAGGRLWEFERQPRWDCYCQDWSWRGTRKGESWLAVRSPLEQTAHSFVAVAAQCGVYRLDLAQLITKRYRFERLLPWKTFPEVYEVCTRLSDDDEARAVDWECYERQRTWWRGMMELGGLPSSLVGTSREHTA